MPTSPRQSRTQANTVLKYTPVRQSSTQADYAVRYRINSPPRQRHTGTNALNVLKYTSPRCKLDDMEFLPSTSLQQHDERWKHMSQQAGPHKQDGSVLDLTSRRTSPQTLKVGVPPQVASHVRELHLHMEDSLPEWLDVVSSLFFNLEHLYTLLGEENNTESARMRRLYILYRFPDLLSIDGKPVTKLERQLARPSSPNGYKVRREDWVIPTNGDEASDGEEESMIHGDAVEVSLFGVVKRVSADPPREEWDEPELPRPYEPAKKVQQGHTRVVQNHTKSVEKAHRTIRKPPPPPQQRSAPCGESSSTPRGNSIFGPLGGNPCVGSSSRAPLDEPRTFEYQDATTRAKAHGDKRATASKSQPLPLLPQTDQFSHAEGDLSLECQKRILPIKTSPSTSLSSPFPMQFRSNSFNGYLPSRHHGLTKKNSAPDLVPDKQLEVSNGVESSATRETIESSSSPKWSSPNGRSRRAERPPTCPGARRVVPVEKGRRRRSWSNKSSIRRTSLVDDFEDDDDDSCSTEEELIE